MPVFRVPANISWSGTGSPGVNVWSVRTDEAFVTIDELDSAITALHTFYESIKAFLRNTTVVSIGPGITDRVTQETEDRPAQNTTSTASVASSPSVLSVCASWRTSLAARRAMGRSFIGPLSSACVETDGSPATGLLTPLNAALQALLASSTSSLNGWAVGVWGLESPGSYDSQGRLIPGQPHVHRDITGFRVQDKFAVLRSRRD